MRGTASRTTVIGLVALALCAAPGLAEVMVVKAGRIITGAGKDLESGTILIQDGRITRIGADPSVPADATVIDAGDSVVMPGLVDANARYGVVGDPNEQSEEITPTFSIAGAIDLEEGALQRAVQLGVTTARVVPGNSNVVSGGGTVIKTSAPTLAETIIHTGPELTVIMGNDAASGNRTPRSGTPNSFKYRQPTTRMGVVWLLRQALFGTQESLRLGEELDERQQVFADALNGRTPVYVPVRSAIDIETTYTIADEFGLKRLVFVECTEGYKMAHEIARRKTPVVLGPMYTYPRTWPERSEGWDVNWNNAGWLTKAGVKVALASNTEWGPQNLLTWAAMAVRNGLPPEDALKAVTSNAADIAGVSDRVGRLQKGKDADLLVLSGDPLAVTSRLEKVIINGRVAFDAGSGANADG